jgi:hypothetical protein
VPVAGVAQRGAERRLLPYAEFVPAGITGATDDLTVMVDAPGIRDPRHNVWLAVAIPQHASSIPHGHVLSQEAKPGSP